MHDDLSSFKKNIGGITDKHAFNKKILVISPLQCHSPCDCDSECCQVNDDLLRKMTPTWLIVVQMSSSNTISGYHMMVSVVSVGDFPYFLSKIKFLQVSEYI